MVDYMGTDPTKVVYMSMEAEWLPVHCIGVNGGLSQTDWTQAGVTPPLV